MAKKQRKRHPAGEWRLPPHAEEARASSQRWARIKETESRPHLPGRKTILGMLGVFVLAIGIFLGLLLPANSLVDDLGDRGVTASSLVTGVDNKPKYVKVRFDSPSGTVKTDLSEFAGMVPDVQVGETLTVVYDPKDPSRALSKSWVEDPPYLSLPLLGTAALTLLCTALTVAVILRRRWYIRTFGPPPLANSKTQAASEPKKRKGKAITDLTKP